MNRTQQAAPEELLHAAFLPERGGPRRVARGDRARGGITYGELDRQSNALGRALRARGARLDTLVAIACEKGIAQALGALGVLKSGAAYLPVDPAWPRERLWGIWRRVRRRSSLTQARFGEPARWPAGRSSCPWMRRAGCRGRSPLGPFSGPTIWPMSSSPRARRAGRGRGDRSPRRREHLADVNARSA